MTIIEIVDKANYSFFLKENAKERGREKEREREREREREGEKWVSKSTDSFMLEMIIITYHSVKRQ